MQLGILKKYSSSWERAGVRDNLEVCSHSVVTDMYKNVGINPENLFWGGGMCSSEEEERRDVE